jgi:hypothetical protein
MKKMTIEEIDAKLMSMPISPTSPEDVAARADLMVQRYAVEASARNAAANRAAAEKKQHWGLPLARVPIGVHTVVINGRSVSVDIVDDERIMRLTAGEVRQLASGNAQWTELNHQLISEG